jgi:single-strand DNA-binding protein
MQVITIAGRIGKDAELRNTNGGDAVCGFSVAVDSRQGREKVTNWFRVSLWGKRGEALSQYLTKGSSVTIIGEFSLGEYDGKPQLNVRASEVALQGGNTGGGQQQSRESDGSRGSASNTRTGGGRNTFATDLADDLDDDIPFMTNEGLF